VKSSALSIKNAGGLGCALTEIPPFLTTLQKRIKKIENIVKT
jgi:hypothetical protein